MTCTAGTPSRAMIIAEAGVNHNGDISLAHRLIDAAADAGADFVKFQTFVAGEVISQAAPKAEYQLMTSGKDTSQLEMVRALELSRPAHYELADHCRARGIEFLSTPFDLGSLAFLSSEMRLETIKIPSGEITNGPFLVAAGASDARIILSTGMSTLDEIAVALGALAFGGLGLTGPSSQAFRDAAASENGRQVLRERVVLLHCTTEYPAPFAEINLRAMGTLRQCFGLPVGISDHSVGISVAIGAAALGAAVIEKHFTLDRSLPGPDHKASLVPAELTAMVASVREIGLALGDGDKGPTPSEVKNMAIVRKSLVARHPIRRGEILTSENLTVKRPGTGVSPMEYWAYLGQPAARDMAEDEVI